MLWPRECVAHATSLVSFTMLYKGREEVAACAGHGASEGVLNYEFIITFCAGMIIGLFVDFSLVGGQTFPAVVTPE